MKRWLLLRKLESKKDVKDVKSSVVTLKTARDAQTQSSVMNVWNVQLLSNAKIVLNVQILQKGVQIKRNAQILSPVKSVKYAQIQLNALIQ